MPDHPSILRAVLRSGPFAEGWAVYTEDMLADAGYLDSDPLFRLVQLKFYLRALPANSSSTSRYTSITGPRRRRWTAMVGKTFQGKGTKPTANGNAHS